MPHEFETLIEPNPEDEAEAVPTTDPEPEITKSFVTLSFPKGQGTTDATIEAVGVDLMQIVVGIEYLRKFVDAYQAAATMQAQQQAKAAPRLVKVPGMANLQDHLPKRN